MTITEHTTPKLEKVEDRLITKKQASERLSVSTRTIDRMAANGLLDRLFIGTAPRFRNSDIDAIIANGLR